MYRRLRNRCKWPMPRRHCWRRTRSRKATWNEVRRKSKQRKSALHRAEKLLADQAGSAMAVDDAQGLLNVAQSTLHAAEEREQQLAELATSLNPDHKRGQATPLVVIAPASGVVRNLRSAAVRPWRPARHCSKSRTPTRSGSECRSMLTCSPPLPRNSMPCLSVSVVSEI